MKRSWYNADIVDFQQSSDNQVLAELVRGSAFPVLQTQRDAWLEEIRILRTVLNDQNGWLHLEGTSKNLLRVPIAALGGTRNPHVLHVHSGFSVPSALHSGRSSHFLEVPLSLRFREWVAGLTPFF
jgi:hypothetical protein